MPSAVKKQSNSLANIRNNLASLDIADPLGPPGKPRDKYPRLCLIDNGQECEGEAGHKIPPRTPSLRCRPYHLDVYAYGDPYISHIEIYSRGI